MATDFDMIVIGGGAAGLTAAGMSAVLGAKTLLIHAEPLGGDCTWHGCVPSKSLMRAARAAHEMRTATRFGLTSADPAHDFAQVMARVRNVQEQIYQEADAPPQMEKLGVELLEGRARFVDRHTVELNGRQYRARRFVIATGSAPKMPAIPGINLPHIVTNETLFERSSLPRHLVVLGGGPVGIEMAQAFQRLGSRVTVAYRGPEILPHDDAELAARLRESLTEEGLRFVAGEAGRIDADAVEMQSGERLSADLVLAALGRKPVVDSLNLAAAGVVVTEQGITVDRRGRTSVKHIYACGDVTGQHLFTHMAEHTAKVVVLRALLHAPAYFDLGYVPWCTFTDPELAHVGKQEAELQRKGIWFRAYRFPYSQLDRAVIDSETTGLVKVLAGRGGTILGVSILGAHAGELIAEYAIAMKNDVTLGNLSATIHAYPTYALANRRAADQWVNTWLTPSRVKWLQRIFRLRGRSDGILQLR